MTWNVAKIIAKLEFLNDFLMLLKQAHVASGYVLDSTALK